MNIDVFRLPRYDRPQVSSRRNHAVDTLLAAVSTATGQTYLENFVTQIGEMARTVYVAIAVLAAENRDHLQTLVVAHDGHIADNITWPLAGSPAAEVITSSAACTFRSRVQERFPEDRMLRHAGAQSYIGVPLFADGGDILGMVILLDQQPIADDLFIINIVQLFADRLVAEIGRLQSVSVVDDEVQQLRDELRRCRSELQVTRKELETFSHTVSHDLRGPLRAIDGFSEALAADHVTGLDDTGRDYLQRIRLNTAQMQRMVGAFLALSRATRQPLQTSTIDISQLARRLLGHLQQQDPEREVTVFIEPGLQAHADPDLLATALEQLLANAWKFTRDTADARIELSSERRAGETVYRVSDNGAGFDMTYANRLFEIFQRLHRQQVYAGTGAGLAIVKCIVQRHGGRIWARGETGAGASFFFTLAAAADTD